jgi:hypothetical protein
VDHHPEDETADENEAPQEFNADDEDDVEDA